MAPAALAGWGGLRAATVAGAQLASAAAPRAEPRDRPRGRAAGWERGTAPEWWAPLLAAAAARSGLRSGRGGRHACGRGGRLPCSAGSRTRIEGAGPASRAEGQGGAKWRTFWCCFFGYAVCYFTRQSLSYTAPVLKQEMGWTGLAQLGQLSSLFPLAYGCSRFLGGVLGDLMSPRKVFCLGLSVCGALNVAFGLSSTLPMFAFFWFLNGCFQGLVAPPCVKLITNWFSAKERGLWWSVWHASINLGGFLIPFLSGGLAEAFGWRFGMLGPGGLALVTAAVCLTLMKDGPEEAAEPKEMEEKEKGAETKAVEKVEEEKKVSVSEGVLLNWKIWALGLAYLLVYVCRQGLGIWGVFYLLHMGAPNAAKAAALFSGFELGGFLGNLTAGAMSDVLLRRARPGQGEAGQRAKVVCGYFLAAFALVPVFARCPASAPLLQYAALLAIGHFLCGCQLLLPLIAAEVAPKYYSGTATGLIGWVGYFGAALAGLPLSRVVQGLGWGWYFSVITGAAGLGVIISLPLLGMQSWAQKAVAAKTP